MLKVAVSIFLAVSLCGLVKAQESAKTETDEEVKKEIMQLEQDKIASLEKGGAAAADWIEKHYVDDLDCIGSGGGAGICTKAEMAAEHRSGERKLRIVHHDDFKVRVYGTTAIMTFRGNNVMERKGKTITGVVRTTDVYVKLNGEWRIVVHQVTPVNE